ncbi:hypothetical protein niasHT_009926 [Heterodera trifolii]|uniref:Uncharacterized protein n=1 Tax=Heterodera trifolii TaxID=157864 RepID=A0ABD2MD79_9BILA
MVKGQWNYKYYRLMNYGTGHCHSYEEHLQCIEFKCSIGNDGLTLSLVRGCQQEMNSDMDCDELTKQCIEDGGKPSKCGKCRGQMDIPCNHGIRPTIACLSGRVNANESAIGLTTRVVLHHELLQ